VLAYCQCTAYHWQLVYIEKCRQHNLIEIVYLKTTDRVAITVETFVVSLLRMEFETLCYFHALAAIWFRSIIACSILFIVSVLFI